MEANEKIKQLMKNLANAINKSIKDSDKISEILGKIENEGFRISLSLGLIVGLQNQNGRFESILKENANLEPKPEIKFEFNESDIEFLQSLNIKLDRE